MYGVVINLATLLGGAVMNPYGGGYFQGPAETLLEAVTACTGYSAPAPTRGTLGSFPSMPLRRPATTAASDGTISTPIEHATG